MLLKFVFKVIEGGLLINNIVFCTVIVGNIYPENINNNVFKYKLYKDIIEKVGRCGNYKYVIL